MGVGTFGFSSVFRALESFLRGGVWCDLDSIVSGLDLHHKCTFKCA